MPQIYSQKPVVRKLHAIVCINCGKEEKVSIHRKCLCSACFTERQTDYRVMFNEEEMRRLNASLKNNGLTQKLY